MAAEKRWPKRLIILVILIVLAAAAFFLFVRPSHAFLIYYVRHHQDKLNDFVSDVYADLEENSYPGWGVEYKYKGWRVEAYPSGSNAIAFYALSFGLAPATVEKGFCYSPDGNPPGYQGVDVSFSKDADGTWISTDEGIYQSCEEIVSNWYYFYVVT